jgi:hypothetical protein
MAATAANAMRLLHSGGADHAPEANDLVWWEGRRLDPVASRRANITYVCTAATRHAGAFAPCRLFGKIGWVAQLGQGRHPMPEQPEICACAPPSTEPYDRIGNADARRTEDGRAGLVETLRVVSPLAGRIFGAAILNPLDRATTLFRPRSMPREGALRFSGSASSTWMLKQQRQSASSSP